MILPLLAVLVFMAVVMTAAWLVVRATANGGWTDVFWTFGTGAALAVAALAPAQGVFWRKAMVAALIVVWAIRLGGYVALRVANGPEDARYRELKAEWGGAFLPRMFLLAIVQSPATTLLAVSVLFAAQAGGEALRVQDVAGALILVAAILGEGVADQQMKRFKAQHQGDHDAVCDAGLWAWSRHPNYLFEALGWLAYPVIAIDLAHPVTLWSLLAPVGMGLLLRFGTGVPPLEAAMVKSKGDAYRRYQERVSALLPRPPKREPA